MTVYRDKGAKTYVYDFYFRGQRYKATTHQQNITDARAVENEVKVRLRRQAGGILRPEDTPRFQQWSEVYYARAEKLLRAPEHVKETLRVVLRFWGDRPGPNSRVPADPKAPYHNLRLADPIEDPRWIDKFEEWVEARGVSAQMRNHYFSMLSRMYRTALLPQYRQQTGMSFNPFAGIPKQRTQPRDVTLTVDQIRDWIRHASYHVRLTAAIAALAPKLRVANVLALEWKQHLDPRLTYITVHDHKTAGATGRPLVAPIPAQLRRILEDARRRHPGSRYVVTYRSGPVKSIVAGVAAAFEAAGIVYGLKVPGGATFHTLRHSMSTLLAEMDESEASRQALMGHESSQTTQKYTHLRPVRERRAAERLSRAVKIADVVTLPHLRAKRRGIAGGTTKPSSAEVEKSSMITTRARRGNG